MQELDVLVVGAGVAGAAAAIGLRRLEVGRVLLIGGRRPERGLVIGESLPPDVRLPLSRLGLWEGFCSQGHDPCPGSVSLWGSDEPGYNDFLFNPHGSGWHVDRVKLEAWLLEEARASGVEVQERTRFRHVTPLSQGGAQVGLSDGRPATVRARVVIDATGPAAVVGRSLGAVRQEFDRLTNISLLFESVDSERFSGLTRLEAFPQGWWHAARLPGGRAVVSVTADVLEAKHLGLTSLAGWCRAFVRTRLVSEGLEGSSGIAESLKPVSARSGRLNLVAGEDWVAIGDAASSYDPISAQGMMKALSSAVRSLPAVGRRLHGHRSALTSLQAAEDADFQQYARNRAYLYERERRWVDEPFWRARRAASTLDSRV